MISLWLFCFFPNSFRWDYLFVIQLSSLVTVCILFGNHILSFFLFLIIFLGMWNITMVLRIRATKKVFSEKCHSSLIRPAAAAAKSLQCPTLCNPLDGSPPGSAVPGILQARTLEWAAISFSNAWKWKVEVKSLSRVWLFETPWTAAQQAPLPMGFSKQEYWSGLPLPSPLIPPT